MLPVDGATTATVFAHSSLRTYYEKPALQNFVCHNNHAGSLVDGWFARVVPYNNIKQHHLSPVDRNHVGCPLELPLYLVDLDYFKGSLIRSFIGFVMFCGNSCQLFFKWVHIVETHLLTSVVIGLEKQTSNENFKTVFVNDENKGSLALRFCYEMKRHSFAIELNVTQEICFTFLVFLKLPINLRPLRVSFTHVSLHIAAPIWWLSWLHRRGKHVLLSTLLLATGRKEKEAFNDNMNLEPLRFDISQTRLVIIARDVP